MMQSLRKLLWSVLLVVLVGRCNSSSLNLISQHDLKSSCLTIFSSSPNGPHYGCLTENGILTIGNVDSISNFTAIDLDGSHITAFAFSPDGNTIAIGTNINI